MEKLAINTLKELVNLTGFGIQEERIEGILKTNGIVDGQDNIDSAAVKNAITQIITENNNLIYDAIRNGFDDVAYDIMEKFKNHMEAMHGR